jgi:hypothetical protein
MIKSRGSTVGLAAAYWLDDRRVSIRVPAGPKIFTSPYRPDRFWGPPKLLSNGLRGFFLVVMRPGHEADHSPPTSAEVKKT